jgi:hypothetical protein
MRRTRKAKVPDSPPPSLRVALASSIRERPLLAMVAAFIVLGLCYALTVPIGGAPDELAHRNYVRCVAEHGSLPVIGQSKDQQEAHQPPLFYVLAVPLYLAGRHWSDAAAVAVLRGFCLLLGALSVVLVYAVAQETFPGRPPYVWLSTIAISLLPMHVFINSGINSDALGEALGTFTLLVCVLSLRGGGVTWLQAMLYGVVLGLCLITKVMLSVLVPILATALVYASARQGLPRRAIAGRVATMVGVCVAVSGWWFWRNFALYGDPLGASAYKTFFHGFAGPEWFASHGYGMVAYYGVCINYMFETFWGMFGHTDIPLSRQFYIALIIVTGAMAIGAAWFLYRVRRGAEADGVERPALVVNLSFLGLLMLAHLAYLGTFMSAQFRYLYPAVAPIGIVMAAGTLAWVPRRARPWVPAIVAGLLVLFNMVALVVYVAPAPPPP